eukprot:COSAG03_NODE_18183_length_360_cov_0.865900_1_plen_59_part_10
MTAQVGAVSLVGTPIQLSLRSAAHERPGLSPRLPLPLPLPLTLTLTLSLALTLSLSLSL